MQQYDCRPNSNASPDCQTSRANLTVQPFPETGLLYDNSNLQLDCLTERIGEVRDKTYSYVVRTVKVKKLESATVGFEQHGSAPNFQGDLLTLCTCKHQMRSRLSAEQWEDDVWIAGFTSRTIHRNKHWLFYLAKVKSANDSHSHLWSNLAPESRNAKAAHLHFLGDIFKPKTPQPTGSAQFLPSRYVMPKIHAPRTERGDYLIFLAAGNHVASGQAEFALARYDLSGSLDTSFGVGGIVRLAQSLGTGYVYELASRTEKSWLAEAGGTLSMQATICVWLVF